MKLKKITVLLLTFGMLTVFSACSDQNCAAGQGVTDPDSNDHSDPDSSVVSSKSSSDETDTSSSDIDRSDLMVWDGYMDDNTVISIYNAENQEIGSIEYYCFYALIGGSKIVYSRAPEDKSLLRTIEYWMYNIETGDNRKLGTVDYIYDAFYETIEADGHLYLSITSGDYIYSVNSCQTIYDVDLSEYSMTPILKIERGVPYNSFTIADNKLILAELLYNGYTDLVEYDLNEKHDTPVVHAYDESDCFVRSSIRHIYADSNNIYMVRLDWDESDNDFLYLDIYDFDYNLLNTVDLRDFCVSPHFDSESEKINEWRQCVSYFFVHNDLIYYENFSAVQAIGILQDDKINRLFDTEKFLSNVYSTSQRDGRNLFIAPSNVEKYGRNQFYRVDPQTHEIQTAEFYADDPKYYLERAVVDDDKILLMMSASRVLPDRLYYIDMNDLEFKPME